MALTPCHGSHLQEKRHRESHMSSSADCNPTPSPSPTVLVLWTQIPTDINVCRDPSASTLLTCLFKCTHGVHGVFLGAFNQVRFKSTQARLCNVVAVQCSQDQGRSPQRSARAGEDVAGGGVVSETVGVGSRISSRR